MDSHMARGAVLIPRVCHVVRRRLSEDSLTLTPEIPGTVVAFQAQREDNRTTQQPGIHRAVRAMTDLASVHANRGVFEYERTPLIHVALQAGLLVGNPLLHHSGPQSHSPGRSRCSMRIMTIRALNDSLIYPVFHRHFKLSPHRCVAGVAEFGLALG
jgi:hypothetical protein